MTTLRPESFTANLTLNGRGWDSADHSASKVFRVAGSGFGINGPNVVLYDDFSLFPPGPIGLNRPAVIGKWKNPISIGGGVPRVVFDEDTGQRWFAMRDPTKIDSPEAYRCGLYFELEGEITEFRISAKFWTPIGRNYPGATSPATDPVSSSCKPIWMAQKGGSSIMGTEFPNANLVFGSHAGGGSWNVLGNDVNPSWFEGEVRRSPWHKDSFNRPTFKTYYQSGVEEPIAPIPRDQVLQFISVNGDENRFYESDEAYTIGLEAVTERSYGAMSLGAWMGNQPGGDYTNVQLYIGDVYVAVGPNSRACIIISDEPTIESSNSAKIIPPATWSDTEITITTSDRDVALQYAHVITASGDIISGLTLEEVL